MLRADGRSKSIEVSLDELESEKIQRYSHEHLTKFTRNFSFPLGSGAYGDVFKGQLPNGEQVAVKVLKNIASDALEYTFMAELSTMSSTSHRNLVRLYGYCFEANMKALVFEYMKNGSFDRVLYENHLNLPWEKLYDIAMETAKALSYLHESCRKVIIHYDVKAGNVLLDSNHSPKVADFGLAKVSKRDVSHISVIQFRGTRGFAAPEMWMQMPVTYKSDVYSFGMLLFEVLGRRRICEGEDWFPGQVWDLFEKKQLDKLIESCGIEEKNREKAKTLSTVALWCTQHSPDKRPTMSLVVQVLEGNVQLRPPPNPQYPYCVSSLASSIYNWIDGSTSISGPPPSPVSSVGFHSSDKRLDVAVHSWEVLSGSVSAEILSRENIGNSVPSSNASTDWNEALDIISFGSPEQSVEGMKVVCHELAQATDDPENTAIDNFIKDADKLVLCLAIKVPKTLDFIVDGGSSRSCKHVLNTLMQTFQSRKLAHGVKESTLHRLITELLLFLLDEKILLIDDGAQLLKASNVLMLKILDNAERTLSFVVLINLLRPLDPSRLPSPASTESVVTINQKFSDLVVKCLIKLTKVLQSTIHEVDLDRILQSIHVYMQELGMEEIRKRAGADDKPLRMVKTVVHELCKLRGTAIKGHFSMVPTDMEPQPIVLVYIDLALRTLASAGMLTPTEPVGQTHSADSAHTSPSPTTDSADTQLKQELAAIFKKIGDKETCTLGLYELYRITHIYPKVDIFSQLQNASEAFRTYIRDGLAQMEKNAAAGRIPSGVDFSPPTAL